MPTDTTPKRGRGRPRKTDTAPVAHDLPKKRGRPALPKQEPEPPKKRGRPALPKQAPEPPKKRGRPALPKQAPEPPKKRGRPAAIKQESVLSKKRGRPAALEQESEPPKKRGRPAKTANLVTSTPPAQDVKPKARRGRPRKHEVVKAPLAVPRTLPRARKIAAAPPALDLPVAKRTKRGRPPKNASTPTTLIPRLDPKIRSKLRDRKQILKDKETRKDVEAKANAQMLGHRRGPGRPRKNAIIPSTRSKAVNTVVARRRARNGYVTWEVPKKHFLQLQQYLRSLQATGKAEANTEVDEEPQIMGGRNSKEVNIDAQEDTQELAVEKTIESDSTVTQATETVEADVQEETLDA